jgi:hypothetical protein
VARRGRLIALLVALVVFGGMFAAARAIVDDDPAPRAVPVRAVPSGIVTINNLERAGKIKPLRSAAGAPPATTTVSP